jgi:hypothetical protein
MEEEKKEKGFVIKDRRHFDDSGAPRPDDAAQTEVKKPEAEAEASGAEKPPVAPQAEPVKEAQAAEQRPLPEIDFANFIISLSTTAMYHFGDFPDPATQESRRNLPAAKQTIDILSVLKAKTEGNLDPGEKELLDGILYELRMRFVKEKSR